MLRLVETDTEFLKLFEFHTKNSNEAFNKLTFRLFVKTAGNLPRSFFAFLLTSTPSPSIKTQKRTWPAI